jgi:hypothetical protein
MCQSGDDRVSKVAHHHSTSGEIQAFELICRHDVDLGLAFAKFDCAGEQAVFDLRWPKRTWR